jgi:hypothetical protein
MATTQDPQQHVLDWFVTHGGSVHPHITLDVDEDSGQHFRAIEDLEIPAGATSDLQVCKCPFNLTLSHLNLLSSPPAGIQYFAKDSICVKLVDKIPTAAVSYFFLVEQRLKGAESFWEPYITSLPKEDDMNTPLWFQQDDLKWLLGTTIHSSGTDPSKSGLEMRRAMWREQWQGGIDVLKEAGDDVGRYSW